MPPSNLTIDMFKQESTYKTNGSNWQHLVHLFNKSDKSFVLIRSTNIANIADREFSVTKKKQIMSTTSLSLSKMLLQDQTDQ